jgi:hypothetical protein
MKRALLSVLVTVIFFALAVYTIGYYDGREVRRRNPKPFERCPSCREWWPRSAFRRFRWFRARRCLACRKVGPRTARGLNALRWPLGAEHEVTP